MKTEAGDDIGTLQTRFVVSEQNADFVFVLAGRRWQAVEVNLEAGVVYAKPAPRGKLPRWLGGDAAFLSPVIVDEHRRILAGEDTFSFLVGGGPQTLNRLRQSWGSLASVDAGIVHESGLFAHAQLQTERYRMISKMITPRRKGRKDHSFEKLCALAA